MEKQEAIEKLREFCKLRAFCELYPDACQKDKCEIYMAIEALSEPSWQGQLDDLISRQDAIDAIHCDITVTGRQNAELVSETIATFVDRIKALPPAQPYTESEIQAMQDLEQAQLDKMYELGWKEGREALEKEIWEDGRDRID